MKIHHYLFAYGFVRQSKRSQFFDIICDNSKFTYRYINKFTYKLAAWDTGECYKVFNQDSFTFDNLFSLKTEDEEFDKFHSYIKAKIRAFRIDEVLNTL